MALGTNYRRVGRKEDLITRICIKLNLDGMSVDDCYEESRKLRKMPASDLDAYWRNLNKRNN